MAEIQKGTVSSILEPMDRNGDPTRAKVIPATADASVSYFLTIPWWLRGTMGNLEAGTQVAYAAFNDYTGVLLARMDGEWTGEVPGDVTIHGNTTVDEDSEILGEETVAGNVTAADLVTGAVASYNGHTHGGVESGGGSTSGPQ